MITILKEDQAKALAALFNAAQTQGMGVLHWKPGHVMDEAEAAALLKKDSTRYFDYHEGRVMKIRFGNVRGHYCHLDVALYDRDNGRGAALAALTRAGVLHE